MKSKMHINTIDFFRIIILSVLSSFLHIVLSIYLGMIILQLSKKMSYY